MDRITRLVELRGRNCLAIGATAALARFLTLEVGAAGRFRLARIDGPVKPVWLAHTMPGPRPDFLYERGDLAHRPDRDRLLHQMVEELMPGGVLLVEEWDVTAGVDRVLHAPQERREAIWRYKTFRRECTRLRYPRNASRIWAMNLHRMLVDLGLTDVRTVAHAESWNGGSTGSRNDKTQLRQHGTRLVGPDLHEDQLTRFAQALDDHRVQICSPLLYSVSGCKPRAAGAMAAVADAG